MWENKFKRELKCIKIMVEIPVLNLGTEEKVFKRDFLKLH
jgi:hypothetical protein